MMCTLSHLSHKGGYMFNIPAAFIAYRINSMGKSFPVSFLKIECRTCACLVRSPLMDSLDGIPVQDTTSCMYFCVSFSEFGAQRAIISEIVVRLCRSIYVFIFLADARAPAKGVLNLTNPRFLLSILSFHFMFDTRRLPGLLSVMSADNWGKFLGTFLFILRGASKSLACAERGPRRLSIVSLRVDTCSSWSPGPTFL